MIAKNCYTKHLKDALALVNKKYEGNITFNNFTLNNKNGQIQFTLKCVSSKGPGHSRSFRGYSGELKQRLVSCCWHVHGDFFDALLEINPDAVIIARGKKIDKTGGNWQNWNAGGMINPIGASEKCDCNKNEIEFSKGEVISGQLKTAEVKFIKQSDLTAECWLVQAFGRDRCKTCEVYGTEECGGQEILKTGRNKKGKAIPLGK